MKITTIAKTAMIIGAVVVTSCSSDDDTISTPSVVAPATYTFERDGESTVDFNGQTTRIVMGEEFISALQDNTRTETSLDAMFAHVEGAADFEDTDLNASDKSIRSKVAASQDFFSANTTDATAIKTEFDSWIANQVTDVFPNWTVNAEAGIAGMIQEAGGGSNRYVNANGLEYNQAINKGLIGALMIDQALNNYLGTAVLDEADNRANNDAAIVADGKTYTTMEHKWDEAYGYVYGTATNTADPNSTIGDDDSFLNKYVGRVENDPDFAGTAATIFDAFKLGRAAIVAKEYGVRDTQAGILRQELSKVVAVRAVYYLQQGKNGLEASTVDYASVFHDLSEGFGFIYSLQFTRRPTGDTPYFTRTATQALLDQLMAGTNGLWDVTPATLQAISETIAAQFDFTVAQAGS